MPTPPGPSDAGAAGSSAGRFGMAVLLVTLSVLFAASLVMFLFFRIVDPNWHVAGAPGLPTGMWISTAILLVSSLTMHAAWRSVRKDRRSAFIAAMLLTTLLGVGFLAMQTWNWLTLIAAHAPYRAKPFAFFYVLTGLHGLHVVGGLAPLVWVTTRAMRGGYSAQHCDGVAHCATYWHFLDVVWLILFGVLLLAG